MVGSNHLNVDLMRSNTWLGFFLCQWVAALPQLAFPLNSQVPPVARNGHPFSFTFSPSTFSYDTPFLNYSAAGLASWLSLDGPSRTFSGTPPDGVDGPFTFNLTASDSGGTATNYVTFLVTNETGPQINVPISTQLEAQGEVDGNGGFIITPLKYFQIALANDTFSDSSRSILNYYAVSTGHTPLPSWVTFHADNITLTGLAPQVYSSVAPPQYYSISIIASDYVGFGGAAATFDLVIGAHQLSLSPFTYSVNGSVSEPLNFSVPLSSIKLDGATISHSNISSSTANITAGSWLSFDNSSMSLIGIPQSSNDSTTISIDITDVFGSIVTVTAHIQVVDGIFTSNLSSINATLGQPFTFTFNSSLFAVSDVVLSVSFDAIGGDNWLSYDSNTKEIYGTPSASSAKQVTVTVRADSASLGKQETESFAVNSFSTNNTSPIIIQPNNIKSNKTLAIILGILLPLLVLIIIGCVLFAYWRKRRALRTKDGSQKTLTPTGHNISRPYNKSPDGNEPWPILDEKAWDEPRRLSALGIFKPVDGYGMTGYMTEIKEPSISSTSSGSERAPLYDYQYENELNGPRPRPRPISDTPPQLAPLPYPDQAVTTRPPAYIQPNKSWRRRTLSSRHWDDYEARNPARSSDGSLATVSTNEIFSVRLVNSPNPATGEMPPPSIALTPRIAQHHTPNTVTSESLPVVNIIPADDNDERDSIGSYSLSSVSNYTQSNPYTSQSTGSTSLMSQHQQSQSHPWTGQSLSSIDERASDISSSQPTHDGRWYSRRSAGADSMGDIDEDTEYGVATRVSAQPSPISEGWTQSKSTSMADQLDSTPAQRAKLLDIGDRKMAREESKSSVNSSSGSSVAFL